MQDARIKVVHKKNGGLSDARNEGLRKSSGKYICFVDSDDYVSTKFVETLYELLHEYNTDMSAVSHKNVFSEEQEGYENTNHKEITTIFEGEEAIKQLFSNDTFANYAWKIQGVYPDLRENDFFYFGVLLETYPKLFGVLNEYNWKNAANRAFKKCKKMVNLKNKIKYFLLVHCGWLFRIVGKNK